MNRAPVFILCLALLVLSSCIERYYPEEADLNIGALAVNAHLSSIPGLQTIQISRSVSLDQTLFNPVSSCYVEVERSDGEVRVFDEFEPGYYQADLDLSFLQSGADYSLSILTPEGLQYESEYETLYPAPAIENVYYEIENQPTEDPDIYDHGLRFFVDFEIEKDSGRYLRWGLTETYEIQNPDYESRVYDVDRRWYPLGAEQKWLTCWLTREVYEIFTRDLDNSVGDSYRKLPLNFVSGSNRKLLEGYSLLVRQYAHSKGAYWYWSELAKNVQSQGGLFDVQPALTPSNICNAEDENELVIGYFSISGVSEMRIFVRDVPGLDLYRDPYLCAPMTMPGFFHRYPQDKLPLYVATANIMGINESGEVQDECIDCRLYKYSSSEKPDFWIY